MLGNVKGYVINLWYVTFLCENSVTEHRQLMLHSVTAVASSRASLYGVYQRRQKPAPASWHLTSTVNCHVYQFRSYHVTLDEQDTIRYDRWFALENWQASCQFNLARELKNVLNGTEKVENKNQETDGYGRDKRPKTEKLDERPEWPSRYVANF